MQDVVPAPLELARTPSELFERFLSNVESTLAALKEDAQEEGKVGPSHPAVSKPAAGSMPLSVEPAHMKFEVVEPYSLLPNIDDITAYRLMEVFEAVEVPREVFSYWLAYWGEPLWSSKDEMQPPLKSIIEYVEEHADDGSKGVKEKLRHITKMLLEDEEGAFDKVGILALLASHGGVCNVMKEVGIATVYALMTNNAKENERRISLEQMVLRTLRVLRENIVEEMFMATGDEKNTHPLVSYQNQIAEQIGLSVIPDPNPWHSRRSPTIEDFNSRYTVERITSTIMKAINEKPRKIPFQLALSWFEHHVPASVPDPYSFLSLVCSESTGLLEEFWVQYMLEKLDILTGGPDWEAEAARLHLQRTAADSEADNHAEAKLESKADTVVEPVVEAAVQPAAEAALAAAESMELPPPAQPVRRQHSWGEDERLPALVRQVSQEEENAERMFLHMLKLHGQLF
eukprot:TRINITY_DN6510_c0_g1_i6.p1 TRINITY_DN6510_c0_g1~~TRINITY_DN6510_c0_g1_i6.p1  ORF type:complete len:458 (-),score=107.65 TRINITY_DN6510_c0_g1_i6:65-1438(-)